MPLLYKKAIFFFVLEPGGSRPHASTHPLTHAHTHTVSLSLSLLLLLLN